MNMYKYAVHLSRVVLSDSTREHRAITQPQQTHYAIVDGYVLRKKNAECSARDEELAP